MMRWTGSFAASSRNREDNYGKKWEEAEEELRNGSGGGKPLTSVLFLSTDAVNSRNVLSSQ